MEELLAACIGIRGALRTASTGGGSKLGEGVAQKVGEIGSRHDVCGAEVGPRDDERPTTRQRCGGATEIE